MIRRALAPIVIGVLLLVTVVGGSSPAARPDRESRVLDLLASAHPSSAKPAVTDTAYASTMAWGPAIKADTAALTSANCDGCAGESTSLHVVYVPRSRRTVLDNVATAWAQDCQGCTSTALSVQVVVLGGRPTAVPSNRALSLTAACDGCRTGALAFQVVLVADRAAPLSAEELASLRAWVDEQAAALRASVTGPLPEPPTPTPTETPSPTPEPTATPTVKPTPTEAPPPLPTARPQVRRSPASALDQLEDLLSSALSADVVAGDVDVSR